MRGTSVSSFEQIKDSGLLSKARLLAFEAIVRNGPVTGSELNAILRSKSGHKRLSELQRLGLVEESGRKICSKTGHEVIAWKVKDEPTILAEQLKKVPRPSKEDIKETLKLMRQYYRKERDSGTAPGDEFIRVMRWLVFLTE